MIFDFIDGGAEDEVTLRANADAFRRLALRPRRLVDVSRTHQATTILGAPVSTPVLLSPTGLARLTARGGEVAVARAAGRKGTLFTLSTMASSTIEDVRAATDGPLWFQLYMWRDQELVDRLVDRVQTAGYDGLMVAVDVPVVGKRERDLRSGFTLPPRLRARTALDLLRHPRWMREVLAGRPVTFENIADAAPGQVVAVAQYVNQELSNPGATWEDLGRVRSRWSGPLVLKGVMTAEDTERAIDAGMQGIVVSNHGGRQLDGELGALEALPEVLEAARGRVEVYLEGGVRRGSDVVKALALGARACFVGRPYLYGLANGGSAGVEAVIATLMDEIDSTLALVGRPSIDGLDRSVLCPAHPPLLA
jgi:L-lactate dehydrogenase (cytochrome)